MNVLNAKFIFTKNINMSTIEYFRMDFHGHPALPNIEGIVGVDKRFKKVLELAHVFPREISTLLMSVSNISDFVFPLRLNSKFRCIAYKFKIIFGKRNGTCPKNCPGQPATQADKILRFIYFFYFSDSMLSL